MSAEGLVWHHRYLRAATALVALLALALWLRPLNVVGQNLVPFGCGSAASIVGGELAAYVCAAEVRGARVTVGCLLVAAAVLLVISELVLPQTRVDGWVRGVALMVPLALPLLAFSVAALITTVAAVAADGTLIQCGTAVAPATDDIAAAMCADLPEQRRADGIAGALSALALLMSGAYVTHRRPGSPGDPASPEIRAHSDPER